MNPKKYLQGSLRARVTLFTIGIFLASIWGVALFASSTLRDDLQARMGDQQFSTAALVAADIQQELLDRTHALQSFAERVNTLPPLNLTTLQPDMQHDHALDELFNGGVVVIGLDGQVRASTQQQTPPTVDIDTEALNVALTQKTPTVGLPTLVASPKQLPRFSIVAPVLDSQGKAIGAVIGITEFAKPNFLDRILEHKYAKSGGVILVTPQLRRVVTATDKSRAMQPFPAKGVNLKLDRFLEGYEGTEVYTTSSGVETLGSVKKVPAAGWLVWITLPTKEAFEPIRSLQLRITLATTLLTILAAAALEWMMRREFMLLRTTSKLLADMSYSELPKESLPTGNPDELGSLIGGINRLLTIVTQREAELLLNAERLDRAQRVAEVGSWELNLLNGELLWSNQIFRLFEIDRSKFDATYEAFLNAIHPDDRDAVNQAYTSSLVSRESYEITHRLLMSDDRIKWVHERCETDFDEEGRALESRGTVQDVTERRQMELKLRSQEALRESERRASTIINASPMPLAVNDEKGHIRLLNSAFVKTLGYTLQDIPTLQAWWPRAYPDPHYRQWVMEAWQHRLEDSKRTGEPFMPLEIAARCKDGVMRTFMASATPLADGHSGEHLVSFYEITGRKREEQALIEAKDEAERANLAKSEFLSRMSHELRTPLNAVIGFAQLLETEPQNPLSEIQLDNVHEILQAGSHLLELINEVLDLSRVESGKLEVQLTAILIASTLEKCIAQVLPLATKRRISIELEVHHAYRVLADHLRLDQVLLNLLSNAIKYNREGGHIAITCMPAAGHRLRISVRDTGHGISANDLPRLFQAFERIASDDEVVEGTGIGLALSKKLVLAMRGDIGASSQPGQGSTFWFELPLVDRRKILYIEDDPANQRHMREILGVRADIELLEAPTALAGLGIATDQHPDLILLASNLPGMNDYQLLRSLKSDGTLKTIPVAAVGADTTAHDLERGKAAGLNEYLTRPLDKNRLLTVIDELLHGAAADEKVCDERF